MKTFKSLVFAGIFTGLSVNLAYADDIEDVVMASEDTVEIAGTLTGCAERPMTSETSCENNIYTIKLFAEPQADEDEACQEETNAFFQSFTLPEDTQATDIEVQLISGVDEDGAPITQDFERLAIEEINEEECADSCSIELELCNDACDTDNTCTDECDEGDTDCIDACVAQCQTDCLTVNEECLASCEEPETAIICTPETLNLKANGRWVTCLVQSAAIITVEDVDFESIMLNGTIPAEKACMQEDLLMVKFSRPALIESLLAGDEEIEFPMETELVVTGTMVDGSSIEETDTINVIFPQPKEKQVKAQKKVQSKAKKKGKK